MAKQVSDLVIKRIFKCSKRTLFDAWSTPSIMANWLYAKREPFCKSTITSSFSVGGDYSVTMHMEGTDVHIFGTYTEINRYNRIAFTWTSPVAKESQVVLDFSDLSANRTEFTLTHNLFPSDEVRASHNAGWDVCLDHLQERVLAA